MIHRDTMYRHGEEHLFRLFDVAEMDHAVDAIAQTHDANYPPKPSPWSGIRQRSGLSQTIDRVLRAPLDDLIGRILSSKRGANAADAAQALYDAVAHTMRILARQKVTKSLAAKTARELRAAWLEFIAQGAAHRMYDDLPRELEKREHTRAVNRANRAGKVKPLDMDKILADRKAYDVQHWTYHGWLTEESRKLQVSTKTLKNRLKK